MKHSSSAAQHRSGAAITSGAGHFVEDFDATPTDGREWDAEFPECEDVRDAENIDLDTECINEALERKASRV